MGGQGNNVHGTLSQLQYGARGSEDTLHRGYGQRQREIIVAISGTPSFPENLRNRRYRKVNSDDIIIIQDESSSNM